MSANEALSGNDDRSGVSPAVSVGEFMREQVLSRLREACLLASEDLGGRLDRVRDLVADVLVRVDGIELARLGDGAQGARQPASALCCTALAASGGEPVSEFLLIPFGEVVVERPVSGESFAFTRAHAQAAVRWFEQIGRKLAIDYEHQSFDRLNTRDDGLRPAAGWVGGLEIRDDGLWAVEVMWTDRAADLLRSGEYRYFSPVIYWTDEDHRSVAALGPVGLTNDPAMRGVTPLAASREAEEATVDSAGSEDAEGEDSAGELRAALKEAQREVAVLHRQLAGQAADAFIERGLRLGKIVESTSGDWREDYLRDAATAELRLSRAPVLLSPGRLVARDLGRAASPVKKSATGGIERPASGVGPVGAEPEDLAAFERALASGWVRMGVS